MSSFLGGGGGGGGLTIGTTPIVGGTNKRLFYDDAGVVNEAVGTAWDKSTQTLTISGPSTTHGLLVGSSSVDGTYNVVSLNGTRNDVTNIGFGGGGGTDKTLYLEAPSGGSIGFTFANSVISSITENALTVGGGTVTTSNPVLNLSQTWNNAAVAFTGLKFVATDTASAAGSLFADFQTAAAGAVLSIKKNGDFLWTGSVTGAILGLTGGDGNFSGFQGTFGGNNVHFSVQQAGTGGSAFSNFSVDALSLDYNNGDVVLRRDAAGILAQRNSTNAQTLRVYNTYTDASNYERGIADWNGVSNVYQIGTEKAGTGSARPTAVIAGGTEVVRALTAGNVKFSNAASFSADGIVATVLGSLGPAGSNTTVQTWLTIVDNTGATRYIPCF